MDQHQRIKAFPNWEIVRKIGEGSYGAVYEIQRDLFGKTEKAALKVLSVPHNESDVEELVSNGYNEESITSHFNNVLGDIVREYQLMAEMKGNSNIVDCDDIVYYPKETGFGWDIYIKMELLTPLTKVLRGPATDAQVIKLGLDMCKALVVCYNRKIVHRDIKPQNIFVSKDGDYKLGDFGVAKTVERASSGTKTGTYNYMAPEVYNNQPYGHPVDIYSLGLVLYWMLNDRRGPFVPLPPAVPTAAQLEDARVRRFNGEPLPPPAHGSEALKRVVLKACAYDLRNRYQHAGELYNDLLKINAAQGAQPRPQQPQQPAAPMPPEPSVGSNASIRQNASVGPNASMRQNASVVQNASIRQNPSVGPNASAAQNASVRQPAVPVQPPIPQVQPGQQAPVQPPKQTPPQPPKQTPPQPPKQTPPQPPRQTPPQPPRQTPAPVRKKSPVGLILGIAGGLLVAILAVVLLLPGKKPSTTTTPRTTPVPQQTAAPAEPAHTHRWVDATCDKPKTCSLCGATEGEPLGHDWQEATYDRPETCARCGQTRGNVKGWIGNLRGAWDEENYVYPYGQAYTNPFVLEQPLTDCMHMNMHIKITINSGTPYADWFLYGRSTDGSWTRLASFPFEESDNGNEFIVEFTFHTPVSFDQLAVLTDYTGAYTYSFDATFTDVQVK